MKNKTSRAAATVEAPPRWVIELVVRFDVNANVSPDALFEAHRAAEDAAGAVFGRNGATEVLTIQGLMKKARKR